MIGKVKMTNNLLEKIIRRPFLKGEQSEDFLIPVFHGVNEWEDCVPSINKLNRMCEEYPALDSAFEKFKTAYNLVIDDWESKND
jgi:hypothetical protein